MRAKGEAKTKRSNWIGFLVGCCALAGFAWLLGWSSVPEGGVLAHNRHNGIDATPLFYTEVEDLERIVSPSIPTTK